MSLRSEPSHPIPRQDHHRKDEQSQDRAGPTSLRRDGRFDGLVPGGAISGGRYQHDEIGSSESGRLERQDGEIDQVDQVPTSSPHLRQPRHLELPPHETLSARLVVADYRRNGRLSACACESIDDERHGILRLGDSERSSRSLEQAESDIRELPFVLSKSIR